MYFNILNIVGSDACPNEISRDPCKKKEKKSFITKKMS